ncbi:MAG: NAD(P)/FAD-dependent oxidoreductase [Deltaproteobacteria bacterium]|nr:MAG: NAD(P)/FAD-dependent oxidoreductase [Deltaproteobacteria bacterium]
MANERTDVVVVGAGHNGLVAALLLARAGLSVRVLEQHGVVGGAARTERPFPKAPRLGTSTGAYLLGLMPPELLRKLRIELPLLRRDPHYFLPTTGRRYLLLGSDAAAVREQMLAFFSEQDLRAHEALQAEIAQLREDVAPTWLQEPLTIEETAERFVRAERRRIFVDLCRKPVGHYLDRFGFKSDLLKAMYAVTDGFSGLNGDWDTPGTGMNFLVHNLCRLPGADGTWMIVKGGMGTVTRTIADAARDAGARIETSRAVRRIQLERGAAAGVQLEDGGESTTLKVNLALRDLPRFSCLPADRGQFGSTMHLLPDEGQVMAAMRAAFADVKAGRLPEFPTIEWYVHTTVDPSLRDAEGRHNSALFVQWVPYALRGTTWEAEEARYVQHLLSLCDRFAPGTSDLVVDTFPLTPPKIERHFGISRGHIHHVDNSFGFADRLPYTTPVQGLYSASAGCHPAGSVIGAAGHNAAARVLRDLGVAQPL